MKRRFEELDIKSYNDKRYLGDLAKPNQAHWSVLYKLFVEAKYPFNHIYMIRNNTSGGVNRKCMEY